MTLFLNLFLAVKTLQKNLVWCTLPTFFQFRIIKNRCSSQSNRQTNVWSVTCYELFLEYSWTDSRLTWWMLSHAHVSCTARIHRFFRNRDHELLLTLSLKSKNWFPMCSENQLDRRNHANGINWIYCREMSSWWWNVQTDTRRLNNEREFKQQRQQLIRRVSIRKRPHI